MNSTTYKKKLKIIVITQGKISLFSTKMKAGGRQVQAGKAASSMVSSRTKASFFAFYFPKGIPHCPK